MLYSTVKLTREVQKRIEEEHYNDLMKGRGIASAKVVLKIYKFGEPVPSNDTYRKIYYNDHGKVAKKLSYDSGGNLEMKEENVFDEQNNHRPKAGLFTTKEGIYTDEYVYDEKGRLVEYLFNNLSENRPAPEREVYEYDEKGRISFKRIYDFNGFLSLQTEYFYKEPVKKKRGKSRGMSSEEIAEKEHSKDKFDFQTVTDENDDLVITFAYEYDKNNLISSLAGMDMHYKDFLKLSAKEQKAQRAKSKFLNHYIYNKQGNITKFIRSIPQGEVLDLEKSFVGTGDYVITQMFDYKYEDIKGKEFLVSITEFDPRYLEPMLVKDYQYFGKDDGIIYPPPPSSEGNTNSENC